MVGVDRRGLIKAVGLAGLSVLTGRTISGALPSPEQEASTLHPLTRSLLEKARRCRTGEAFDRRGVERTIRRFAEATGAPPLAIEWPESPNGAFDRLRRFGLEALLRRGDRAFWRQDTPWPVLDDAAFDRAFFACSSARDHLCADEADRLLMAPKLALKEHAMSAALSPVEAFQLRATAAQVGWLETSMSEAAAQAVANVEALLSEGTLESVRDHDVF